MALSYTIDAQKKVLNITNIENSATDSWDWTDHFQANMGLHSLQFIPGSDGTDECVVRVDSSSGPKMFRVECADVADQRPLEFNGEIFDLSLTVSDGNYSTGSELIIIATARKMGPRH